MKILVVEDEPAPQEVILKSLEQERYVVETAGNCLSTIRKVGAYNYDCILPRHHAPRW